MEAPDIIGNETSKNGSGGVAAIKAKDDANHGSMVGMTDFFPCQD